MGSSVVVWTPLTFNVWTKTVVNHFFLCSTVERKSCRFGMRVSKFHFWAYYNLNFCLRNTLPIILQQSEKSMLPWKCESCQMAQQCPPTPSKHCKWHDGVTGWIQSSILLLLYKDMVNGKYRMLHWIQPHPWNKFLSLSKNFFTCGHFGLYLRILFWRKYLWEKWMWKIPEAGLLKNGLSLFGVGKTHIFLIFTHLVLKQEWRRQLFNALFSVKKIYQSWWRKHK